MAIVAPQPALAGIASAARICGGATFKALKTHPKGNGEAAKFLFAAITSI